MYSPIFTKTFPIIKAYIKSQAYTLKNKGAWKVLHSEAIEEPFLVPQRTIHLKSHLFLTFL